MKEVLNITRFNPSEFARYRALGLSSDKSLEVLKALIHQVIKNGRYLCPVACQIHQKIAR